MRSKFCAELPDGFSLRAGAVVPGFMMGNALLWLVAPVCRIFETEEQGHPGSNFRAAMGKLFLVEIWVFTDQRGYLICGGLFFEVVAMKQSLSKATTTPPRTGR